MRDDIHRRLPLTRVWKRAVRACVRDAEAPLRTPLLEQAARTELGALRPAFLEGLRHALASTQAALFPGETFVARLIPTSPIEAAIQRECAALADARLPAGEALAKAAELALDQRVGAVVREIRAQLSVDSPGDCAELVLRFLEARRGAELGELVRGHLAGEIFEGFQRLTLDLDTDLRSQP
jgi:hypothetical protein